MAVIVPTILAGGSLISGLVTSWQGSQRAKEVDRKTAKAIEEALAAIEKNIKMPEIDPTPVTMEQYKLLQQYVPKVAQYVQEKSPQIVTEEDSLGVKEIQKQALQDLVKLSKTGGDAKYESERAQADFEATQANKRATTDMLRQYSNQGLGGSGQELLAQVANNQASETSRRLAMLQAAAGSQDRRTNALQASSQQAGQMRDQNYRTESANLGVINAFNQRNAQSLNEYNQGLAKQFNDAQKYNMEAAQGIDNNNVGVRNQNKVNAQQRGDMVEREKRLANNEKQYNIANMKTGQAAQQRSAGQDAIARDGAMVNQFISGTGKLAGAYVDGQDRELDREIKKKKLGGD